MPCYCLHPGGQGITKVLQPPEPGMMETGLECNATLPISSPPPEISPENWYFSVGNREGCEAWWSWTL